MNRPQRRAALKGKSFNMERADLHKQADVLFIGLNANVGEVIADASPIGRAALGSIVPDSHIAWRGIRDNEWAFPDNWLEFNFLLPGLIASRHEFRLLVPEYLLKLKAVEDVSADQFAYLMAIALKDQGIRAAMYSEKTESFHIFLPSNDVN